MARVTTTVCDSCGKPIEDNENQVSVSVQAQRASDPGAAGASREQYEYHLDHAPTAFQPKVDPGRIFIDGRVRDFDGLAVEGEEPPKPEGQA